MNFSSLDVIKVLGIKRQRLRGWTDDTQGFFSPSVQRSGGPGRKALYSRFDLYCFRLFQHLIENLSQDRVVAASFVGFFREVVERRANIVGFDVREINFLTYQLANTIEQLEYSLSTSSDEHTLTINYPANIASINVGRPGVDTKITSFFWESCLIINFKKIWSEIDATIDSLF